MIQRTDILQDQFESELRLAHGLIEANRIAEAEQTYRNILRESPAHPAASLALGLLLHHANRHEAAIEYLQTAVTALPQQLEARYSLAVSLHRLQRVVESARQFEEVIRYHPNTAEAHNYLGIVRAQLDQSRLAENHFFRALELMPSLAEAHKNLGTLYGEQGRIDDARYHLKQAFAQRPNYAQAYWQYASITKFSDFDDVVRAIKSSYERPGVADTERMRLAYALGKAFDDLGQYSLAFSYWEEGNRLRGKLSGYDIRPVLAEIRAIKRVFSAAFCKRANPGRATTPKLIFIVGMPRSGTSLTEQILASHSAVYGAGELETLDAAIRGAVRHFPADIEKLKPADWESIRECYLRDVSDRAADSIYVTDKMPSNFFHIGAIGILFPDAKIVHCRRNAMDTALSCFRNHFVSERLGFTCDLRDLGRYYRQYLDLMAHWGRIETADIYDIRYESVVADPEREVRNLLEFCGLPFESGCLEFHENKRPVKTASAIQVRQPIYRSSVHGWKHYEREIQPFRQTLNQRSGRLNFSASDMISRLRRYLGS